MAKVCDHCGFHNTNLRYCGGCGRKLAEKIEKKFSKLPEGSTVFINEVVNTIERVFRSQEIVTPILENSETVVSVSFSEIGKESGILYIDGDQWIKPDKHDKRSAFFGDIALTYLLSAILVAVAFYLIPVKPMLAIKIFYSCYIFITLFLWLIFPLVTGSTAVSFISEGLSFFKENRTVKGKFFTLLTLSILMMLYSFFPLFFLEYLLMSLMKDYMPLALKVSGISYLKKTGGQQ